MLKCFLDYISYVIIRQRIYDVLPSLLISHKVALPQYLQLMRDGGFRHTEKMGDIANAHWLLINGEENVYSRGITEHLEKIRQIV